MQEYLSPHLRQYYVSFPADSGSFTYETVRFCANGDCAQDIHYKICPQHLNYVQRYVTESHTAQDCNEAQNYVDGKLELDEFAHVFEKGSAPLDGGVNRYKVVVEDNKVRVVLGYIAT